MFSSIGLAVGGLWGLREGARRPLAVSNARLRINAVLNSVTRRGTFIGNSAGVLGTCYGLNNAFYAQTLMPCVFSCPYLPGSSALVYNGINSTIDEVRGQHDAYGSMASGALTGALYKSTGALIYIPVFNVSWES